MIRISLVIPTHNRAAQLVAALESVVRQDLPRDEWECVVVSNNSTDDTRRVSRPLPRRIPGAACGSSRRRDRGCRTPATADCGRRRRR